MDRVFLEQSHRASFVVSVTAFMAKKHSECALLWLFLTPEFHIQENTVKASSLEGYFEFSCGLARQKIMFDVIFVPICKGIQ